MELNNLDINADGNAHALYKRKFAQLTSQTKSALYSDDFLDKMKNYSRGLMADFDYKDNRFFKLKNKNVYSFDGALSLENIKKIIKSDDYTNKEKTQKYVDFICFIFNFIQAMSEEPSTYGTFGWINGYYYPASDWENVINRRSSMHKRKSTANKAREAAESEIVYKGQIHDVMQEGILKAGVFELEYFTTNKTYKGDELLELLQKRILSKLLIKNERWGIAYNANVLRGRLKSDYNKVWRVAKWEYDGYAWWEHTETLYNYQCFISLGKESYEFLQEFYELGQSDMIQNYLFSTEIVVQNAPDETGGDE